VTFVSRAHKFVVKHKCIELKAVVTYRSRNPVPVLRHKARRRDVIMNIYMSSRVMKGEGFAM
jgi:hypothetical protein